MADITKYLNKPVEQSIDPITGRESDTIRTPEDLGFGLDRGKSAINIGGSLGEIYQNPYISASPMYNLRSILPDESQYDEQLTGVDVMKTLEDPQLLTDMRSGKQTGLDAFGNILVKFGAKTGVNVVGNVIGGGYGIGSAIVNRDFSKLWDNAVINETMKWSEELDKSLPVYKDRAYRDKNFLQSIGNFGMFMDEMSDALAFTAGAVLSGYITAGLATPFRLASIINKGNRVIKGYEGLTALTKGQKALMLADDVLGNTRRIFTASNYEAAVEANGVGKSMIDKITSEVNKKYAKLFDELEASPGVYGNVQLPGEKEIINNRINDLEAKKNKLKEQYDAELNQRLLEAKAQINKAQLGTYITNAALLYATNSFQFNNTFGLRWNNAIKPKTNVIQKGAASLVKDVTEEGAEQVAKKGVKAVGNFVPKTKLGRVADDIWTFSKNPIAEGFVEEGGQGITSTGFENYYGSRLDPEVFGEAYSFAETFGDAFSEQFTSKEGWKEVLMGVLIGSIGAPGKGILPGNLGIDEETGERGKLWTGGIAGSFQERAKERERYFSEIANVNKNLENYDDVTHALASTHLSVQAANKKKSEAIGKEDKFEFLNARDDEFFAGVVSRERAGLGDSNDASIEEMERMTPDEFINSYSTDESDKQMSAEDKKNYQDSTINQIKENLAKIRSSVKHINRIMPSDPINNYNPEIEAYKEQLSYIAYKEEAFNLRYNQLLKFIEDNKGKTSFGIEELDKIVKDLNTLNLGNRAEVSKAVRAFNKAEEITNKIAEELEEFNTKSESTKNKISEREKIVENINKKLASLDEEFKNLNEELTNLKNNVEHNKTVMDTFSQKESELKEVNDKINSLQEELSSLNSRLSKESSRGKIRKISGELSSIKTAITTLNSKKDKISSEIESLKQDEAFGENWGMELLEEIDKKETLKNNIEKNIENFKQELTKETSKIEELSNTLKINLDKYIKNKISLLKAAKEHKTTYRKILKANKLIAEEKAKNRDVKFNWTNFDDYVNSVIDAYNKSQEIFEEINTLDVEINPLEKDELFNVINDLTRLEHARLESMEIMNYFLSKRGKDAFSAKLASLNKKLFDEVIMKEKEIDNKIKEIITNKKYGSYTDPEKGIPYSYEIGEKDEKKVIKGWIVENQNGVPIFFSRDNSVVVDKDENREYNAIALSKLLKWEQEGKIKELKELSVEEEKVVKESIKLKKQTKLDSEAGKITTQAKVYENTTTGEKYAVIDKQSLKGEVYQEVHLINDDNTIQLKNIPKYDVPDLSSLGEPSVQELEFEGELITLDDNRKNKKGKTVTALLTYETPFMFEGEADHKSTYPTKLRFKPLNGGAEVLLEDTSKEQADKIIDLVNQAQEASQSSEKKVAPGTNKPIIKYNGQEGYIDYNIKVKKFFWKKGKKGKSYKKYYYVLPQKQSVRSIIVSLAEGISQEDFNKALESGEVNSNHLSNLTGKAEEFSNYDINNIEILQEDFISKSGEHYVLFKDKEEGNDKVYAAKKIKTAYEYYEESGQLSRRGTPIKSKDYKLEKYDSYKLIIREGDYKKVYDKNLDKELGTGEDSTIRLGAKILNLNYVAGREVNYNEVKTAIGNIYYEDIYNEDGSFSKNPDPAQIRWYNYFKTAFKTKEDVDNFKKNHFLKVVVNTSPEWKKYFDPNDGYSNRGLDSKGNILENEFDNVVIKVVLVKRNEDGSYSDVTSEGQPLYNTLHSPEFKGFQASNKEETEHYQQEHRNLRESILNYIIKEQSQGRTPNILFPIDNISSGRAGREQPFKELTDAGMQTKRAKFPVIGRIVSEGTDPRAIPWEVVTKIPGSVDDVIPTTIKVEGVEYTFTRPPRSVGSVLTAIKGANGEVIPVELLTRNLTTQEATTVAALLKKVIVEGKNEFKGLKIIPDTQESIKDAVFYLKRFVKYGANNSENKATELYWDSNSKILNVGTQKFTVDRIKTEEGFDSLIAAIQNTKIHHVSNQFNTEFAISYLDKNGEVTESYVYKSYNEYLFLEGNRGSNPPVLQTDVLKYGNPDSVVQVNVGFGSPVVGKSAETLYETKPFQGKRGKTKTSVKASATSVDSYKEIENSISKETLDDVYDLITTQRDAMASMDDVNDIPFPTLLEGLNRALKQKIPTLNLVNNDDLNLFIINKLIEGKIEYIDAKDIEDAKKWLEENSKTITSTENNKKDLEDALNNEGSEVESGANVNDFTKEESQSNEEKLEYGEKDLKDLLGETDENEDKPRLTVLTSTTGDIETENIAEVKEWFKKNLPNIPLNIEKNIISLVEGKAWGAFTGKVVKLYEMAEIGTGYHEAFHAVVGVGLTKKQRNLLWNIVKKETGSKNISYKQAEELLAEDFREWKLYGKSKFNKTNKVKLSIFQRISNFINSIISFIRGETYIKDISDLYSKIDTGAFKHINIKEGTTELSKDMWKPREWAGLSVIETEDLITGITPKIIDELYLKYNGDFSLLSGALTKIITSSLVKILNPNNSSVPVTVKNKIYKGIVKDKKGLIEHIRQNFEYIGMKMDIEANELDGNQEVLEDEFNLEEVSNKENLFADSNTVSNLRRVSNEIKVIISTIQEIDSNGDVVLNSMGLPKVLDASTAYITLLDYLSGTLNWNELYNKLKELSKIKPEYNQVIERLDGLSGKTRLLIRNKFRQAMSINKYGYKTYLIGKDGGTFINSSTSRNIDRLKEEMDSGYKQSEAYKDSKKDTIKTNTYIKNKIKELEKGLSRDAYTKEYKDLMDYLGISSVLNIDNLLKNTRASKELLLVLKESFDTQVQVVDLNEITGGKIRNVLMIESINRKDFYEPQVTTSANKTVYQYSLNNYYSTIKNIINNVKSVEELFNKLPHLKAIAGKSMWLNQIVNNLAKGESPSLNITFLEGMREDISGQEGNVTYDLSKTDIIKMHIEGMLLHNLFTLRRPSDKALEPAIEGVYINKDIIKDNDFKSEILLNYIKYDLASNNNKKLAIFDSILSEATKEIILNSPNQVALLSDKILEEFNTYMANKANKYKDYLISNGLIYLNGNGKVIHNLFSDKILKKYTSNDAFNLNEFSRDVAETFFFKTIEQHMLFLGDFGQFSQLFKRTSGATGTGETFTDDAETIQYIQQEYIKQLRNLPKDEIIYRTDLLLKLSESQRKEFLDDIPDLRTYEEYVPSTALSVNISVLKDKVINLKDIDENQYNFIKEIIQNDLTKRGISKEDRERLLSNYMKPYLEMNVADGLGYITIEQYKEWLYKSGKWTDEQEISYQKIINGEPLTFEDVAVFPIIKPQGFGPKNYTLSLTDEEGLKADKFSDNKYNLAFEKLSLIPIIPTAVTNTKLDGLLKSMQKSGVNIAIYQSGFKQSDFGVVEDFNGNEQFLNSFNQSDTFWKIQVQMHPEIEKEDTDGTQQRVLTFLDMFDGGTPIDFEGTEAEWNELTKEEQNNKSELKSLYSEYSEIYSEVIEESKEKFLKESGIVLNANGEYIVRDKASLLKSLKKEINQRRLPSNILKALVLNENGELKFPLDALPIADKIENMLFARAMNSTIRIKRPGAAYVQTSNALWETKDDIKAKKYAERLKFIRNENGDIVGAEVYLPNYMKNIIGDVTEEQFNKLKESNPELFNLIGYRIPTQGQNSMLPLVVKGFLPAEMGDTVIVPFEIVAQSGSDFDIDKLHVFRPSIISDANGNPIKIDKNTNIDDLYNTLKDTLKTLDNLLGLTPLEGEQIESTLATNILLDSFDVTREELNSERDNLANLSKSKLKSLQNKNRILDIQFSLLTRQESLRNILVPNGAESLKEDAAYKEFLTQESSSLIPEGNMPKVFSKNSKEFKHFLENKKEVQTNEQLLDFPFEIETGMAFKGGKKGVAIAANYGKFHAIAQQYGLYLNSEYFINKFTSINGAAPKMQKVKSKIILNYDHNTEVREGENVIILGKRYSINGALISDSYGEHLTANVDIAKDPFIFKLNTNNITAGVKYFMLETGADPSWVNAFLTQPILEEYVNMIIKNESLTIESTRNSRDSVYKSKYEIIKELLEKYGYKLDETKSYSLEDLIELARTYGVKNKKYSKLDLDKGVYYGNKNNIPAPINVMQINILGDFLAYLEYSKLYNDAVQAAKPDTLKLKNHAQTMSNIDNILDVIESGMIGNYDKIFKQNTGILSGFSENHSKFVSTLYNKLFITQSLTVQRNIFNKIKEDIKKSNSKLNEKELDKIRQSFITALLQTAINRTVLNKNTFSPISKEDFMKLSVGKDSVAKKLIEFKKSGALSKISEYLENFLFSRIGADEKRVDYVKVNGKKIDPFTAEKIAAEFEILRNSEPSLYNLLLAVTITQTGMVYSPISFIKHFDSDVVSSMLIPVIKMINISGVSSVIDLSDSIYSNFIDNFYNINRNNPKLVPRIRTTKSSGAYLVNKFGTDVLNVTTKNNNYGRKFVKRIILDKKDGKSKWIDVLYRLEGYLGDVAIYVKINPKGNYMSQEYHSGDSSINPEIVDKENYISTEKRDKIIKDYIKEGIIKESFSNNIEISKENIDDIAKTQNAAELNLLTYEDYKKAANIELPTKSKEEFVAFKKELDKIKNLSEKNTAWNQFLHC